MASDLSPEQEAELHARLSDKEWRLNNIYVILDEDGHLVPFRLRGEQIEFMRERHSKNHVPKARKLGMSTFIVVDYLDECIFNPNSIVGHIDLKEPDAWDKLQIARFAWDNGVNHPDVGIAELWRAIHRSNPLITDNNGELAWSNGSRQTAGTSYTGKTPVRLHISEFGPIASQHPKKAASIKRGSINAVPISGIVDVETTMEGGRFGENYALFKLALDACGKDLSPMDWKLHFFPWHNHPTYRLPGRVPHHASTVSYFKELHDKYGLDIPLDRQAWYEAKKREQGEEIWQQFPSVVSECDRHIVAGQIYPEMTTLRAQGRIRVFNPEVGLPFFTFWDLGSSDNTAGWMIQQAGKDTNWLDWCAGEGKGAAGVASVIRQWEAVHGPIAGHYFPHDVEITDKGSGKTYKQQLIECGITSHQIHVVPRTPDVWVGINELRKRLPNSWFHSRCDIEQKSETGGKIPSGVGRLEGYRRQPVTSSGIIREAPLHDICSHTADAGRTFAEAAAAGMIRGSTAPFQKPTVIAGFRGSSGRSQGNITIRR